ncbi:hypothetical protein OIE13_22805 [Streptosporangium sp. NBC_01810]|nr:hypothetical protein [Streptosporangium sp. NBC_01810]WSA23776.1 hypothetical protein OIE13_22805 [Streptosporangium sp. NBC_01810]
MNAALSPCEMQAIGGAYCSIGVFARAGELAALDREADREPTPTP